MPGSRALRLTQGRVGVGPTERRVIVVDDDVTPKPRVGDILNDPDTQKRWKVLKVQRTRIVMRFQIQGKKLIPEESKSHAQ